MTSSISPAAESGISVPIIHFDLPRPRRHWVLLSGAVCVAIALYSAVFPVYRAFFLVEISYNEGWNAYNAWTVAHHLPLYGSPAGWTTVNYPELLLFPDRSDLTPDA